MFFQVFIRLTGKALFSEEHIEIKNLSLKSMDDLPGCFRSLFMQAFVFFLACPLFFRFVSESNILLPKSTL